MKHFLFLVCLTAGLTATAQDNLSSLRAVGRGVVAHDPEILGLRYSVSAVCFKNADEALSAANSKVNELKTLIQKVADGKEDKVVVPGTQLSYQNPSGRDPNNPNACTGGYSASGDVHVALAVTDKASIVKKFGELQQVTASANSGNTGVETVTVSSSSPQTALTAATRKTLMGQAEIIARQEFETDLNRKMALCGVSANAIISIRPEFPDARGYDDYPAYAAAAPMAFSASRSAPVAVDIELKPISVSYTFGNEVRFRPPFNPYCNGNPAFQQQLQPQSTRGGSALPHKRKP